MSTDLHPDFPVVNGDYVMTKGWRLALPEDFNRRIEDGSLVLWRPELTLWINVWHGEGKVLVEDVLARLLADASAGRSEEKLDKSGGIARLTYELAEDDGDAVNGFVVYPQGYAQIAAYYDSPQARTLAYQVIASVRADQAP